MIEKDVELLKKKTQTYFEKHISVHVKSKDGEWGNGEIKEIGADFFMLQERKKGLIPIFFQELEDIDPMNKEGKDE